MTGICLKIPVSWTMRSITCSVLTRPRCGRPGDPPVRRLRACRGVPPPAPPRLALFRHVEAHSDEVKGQWEERFKRRDGIWRGFVDEQVRCYLDCGLFDRP